MVKLEEKNVVQENLCTGLFPFISQISLYSTADNKLIKVAKAKQARQLSKTIKLHPVCLTDHKMKITDEERAISVLRENIAQNEHQQFLTLQFSCP